MNNRIPLSELVSSGIRLRPAEAVAIVGEICRQRAARVLPGLPSLAVIRLTGHGEIAIEGPVPAGEDTVARAGQLLEELLGDVDAPPEYRASGALRLVVARARGTLDLPAYVSLEEFCAALVRFSTLDAGETVTALVAAYNDAQLLSTPASAQIVPLSAVAAPAEADAPSLRRRRAEYAIWIAAPAAAAVLGYVLALPPSEPAAPVPSAPVAHAAPRDVPPSPEPVVDPPVAEPAPVSDHAPVADPPTHARHGPYRVASCRNAAKSAARATILHRRPRESLG